MTDIQCPLCEEYQSDELSDVATHIFKTGDETHSGYNYQKAEQVVKLENDIEPNPTTSTSNNDPSSDDPVMGSGSSFEETEPEEDLPCGHESFNPEEAPEPPFAVTCDTCEKTFRVTEL